MWCWQLPQGMGWGYHELLEGLISFLSQGLQGERGLRGLTGEKGELVRKNGVQERWAEGPRRAVEWTGMGGPPSCEEWALLETWHPSAHSFSPPSQGPRLMLDLHQCPTASLFQQFSATPILPHLQRFWAFSGSASTFSPLWVVVRWGLLDSSYFGVLEGSGVALPFSFFFSFCRVFLDSLATQVLWAPQDCL